MHVEAPSLIDELNELYAEAGRELLATYGVEATLDSGNPSGCEICSFVSLTGPGIKIVSALQPEPALLRHLYPGDASSLSDADIEDWCGELNNQIAGRMKNKLVERGCDVVLGLPSQVVGREVQASLPRDAEHTPVQFRSEAGALWAIQVVRPDPDFELMPVGAVTQATDGLMREGEISLF